MTKVEICRMCLEYSTDMTCEHIRECKLMKVLDENKRLKERKGQKARIRKIVDSISRKNGTVKQNDK